MQLITNTSVFINPHYRFYTFRKQKREIKNDIEELMKTLAMLDGNFYTVRVKYEELSQKDRMLDKQFKSSFSEHAAQAVVDQAYRIFRFVLQN